jgi:hypothetical protein
VHSYAAADETANKKGTATAVPVATASFSEERKLITGDTTQNLSRAQGVFDKKVF